MNVVGLEDAEEKALDVPAKCALNMFCATGAAENDVDEVGPHPTPECVGLITLASASGAGPSAKAGE